MSEPLTADRSQRRSRPAPATLIRRRISGFRKNGRALFTNPSNHGYRARMFPPLLRYELAAAFGGSTVVGFGERSEVVATKGGDSSGRAVFARLPDMPHMTIWQTWLAPGKHFVDVGANVGLYSLLALEQGATVTAFEPSQRMCLRFAENMRLNGYDSFDLHEVALSHSSGTATLAGPDANRAALTVDGSGETVRTATLDQLLPVAPVDGLKIDVEGFEQWVLEGAPMSLESKRLELIQLEWNRMSLSAVGNHREPVAELLQKAGFHLLRPTKQGALISWSPGTTPQFGSDVFAARGSALELLIERGWK